MERSREGSGDRVLRGTFAFGSSTPRVLSHLSSTARDFGDVRINSQVGRRSYTTPTFPSTRSKTVPAPMNVQAKRAGGTTQKLSGIGEKKVISTSTCRIIPQGRDKSMDFVKEKIEVQNNKGKSMRKTVAKETQLKAGNTDGSKTLAGKEIGFSKKFEEPSPVSATFKSEIEKALVLNEQKPVVTGISSTHEVADEAKAVSVESTTTDNIVVKEATENNSPAKASGVDGSVEGKTVQNSEGRGADANIHTGSFGKDDVFGERPETTNSEHADGTKRKFSTDLGCEGQESFPCIAPSDIPDTSPTVPSSRPSSQEQSAVAGAPENPLEKFGSCSDGGEMKDVQRCSRNSEDDAKDQETALGNLNDEEVDSASDRNRLSQTRGLISGSLDQSQGSDSTAVRLYAHQTEVENHNYDYEYYPETLMPQESMCTNAEKSGSREFGRESFSYEGETRKSDYPAESVSRLQS
uniref:Uncharacterized protein n=1 Tax=Setaria digitata TaxID=48799 RepID=A0A915PXD4_9BILA